MKSGIHPAYTKTIVRCSCGNEFETRSTAEQEVLHVDVCSACHPFFTGKQRIVDSGGRVQRFQDRLARRSKK
ncbi:MAG: 50S ribosomal protein L31 [Rubrobacteraceae bacterium]|uniref:50S ribosomal protein L31 n=1 Tax=Rubrobacter TaxID=42255 RepID=UPI00235EEABC|nr:MULTISPECIES: 50S ribosomal protein L31 [Rubrobacter]MBX6762677.1 50S ribosomal protein L31 [Rubrobacteraceae bacterium]MCL6438420.1 50S ribosomal protein L31 [Rubrobacteraceae bacterium]